MKKILIYGAGGFGREVQWLIERINEKKPVWQLEGYLDDGVEAGTVVNGFHVLGGMKKLKEYQEPVAIVCAVGAAKTREKIISAIKAEGNFEFPNLIDPDVQMSDFISIGQGNIICAGNILTVNVALGDFIILNLSCTVGHDAVLESFVTVYPSVNISGCVKIGQGAELGTGSKIIQGIEIGCNTIVGAGAVVIRDIPCGCVAVGAPAKPVKIRGGYRKLIIVGKSGHGEVIRDLACQCKWYQSIEFMDDASSKMKENLVKGCSQDVFKYKHEYDVFVAIGNSKIRKKLQGEYESGGVSIVSLIHPYAILPYESVKIGSGTVVMADAVIQTGTELGKGVIINTAATVDHDCKISDYVHVAVGAHLAGNVEVGSGTWIGAGAVVSNNIHICENVTVGAGAVVVSDIEESGTYVGVPARKVS